MTCQTARGEPRKEALEDGPGQIRRPVTPGCCSAKNRDSHRTERTSMSTEENALHPTAVCNSRYRIEGARRMLAEALQAEVDAYVARFADERDADGRRLVVRNGSRRSREVLTSAGAVEVTAPRVNDKRVDPATGEQMRFSSAILPPWARKTPKITEVLPLLYLHGLSSGDFVPGWASSSARRRACRWR